MNTALSLLLATFFVAIAARPEVVYPKGLEGVDIDQVINNARLLKQYIKCVLGEGNCTPEGKKLKNIIPDALQNDCVECTDEQKAAVRKVVTHLIDHHTDLWDRLEKKYDPSGNYKKKFCRQLKQEGVDSKNRCIGVE